MRRKKKIVNSNKNFEYFTFVMNEKPSLGIDASRLCFQDNLHKKRGKNKKTKRNEGSFQITREIP